jgi:hypothetical protein
MDDVSAAIRKLVREEVDRALDEWLGKLQRTETAAGRAATQAHHLTPSQTAHLTGLSPQTLANWRTLGKGPAWFKIGRLVRYDEEVLQAWIVDARSGAHVKGVHTAEAPSDPGE